MKMIFHLGLALLLHQVIWNLGFWISQLDNFLCDRNILLYLKGKFYWIAIGLALLYGTKCWVIKRYHVQKMSIAEMCMLHWMCGNTRRDKVRNEDIRTKIGIAPIEELDERKSLTMV